MAPITPSQIPFLAGEATSTAVKILDKLDLFENDGMVAAVPFGKLVQASIKWVRNITDPEQAARHSVGAAVGMCFYAGLKEYELEAWDLRDSEKKQLTEALKTAFKEAPVKLAQFNVNHIYETDVAQHFLNIYFRYLNRSEVDKYKEEGERVTPRLKKFLDLWLTLFWRRLVEREAEKYGSLEKHLSKESLRLKQQLLNRIAYETQLAHMYLSAPFDEPDIAISDLYSEPKCEVLESQCRKGRDSHVGLSKFWDCSEVELPDDLHALAVSWLSGKLDTSGLYGQDHRLLLLYGMPGQGKTTFCKRLLFDLIQQGQRAGRPVYFLRLRRVPKLDKLKAAPLEHIAAVLRETYQITVDPVDFSRSILILDGMDELAMSAHLSMGEADTLLREILNELTHQSNMNVIVTSRHGYIKSESQLSNALVFQLKELDRTQQLEWVGKYRQFRPESVLTAESLENIATDSALGQLMTQPILMQLVADLETLPESTANRADVYEKVFDHIISVPWKEGKRNIPALEGIDTEEGKELFRRSLQEMAFQMFLTGQDYISGREIEEEIPPVKTLMRKLGGETTRDTLKTMYISFYLREVGMTNDRRSTRASEEQEYGIEFVHKSFAEYLVAEYAYRFLKGKFLEAGEYEDYRLNDQHEALKLWHRLFSRRVFTKEIWEYLRHKIENDSVVEQRITLRSRLLHFAPYFFNQGFTDRWDTEDYEQTSTERAIGSAYSWMLVVATSEKKQYLFSDTPFRKNFLVWLRLILTSVIQVIVDLRKADLRRVDLSGTNLSGANLKGANLYGANLSGADLRGADLRDADLRRAYLRRAYLHEAGLRDADLRGADLGQADLREADLRDADLSDTLFRATDLQGADFTKANLRRADLREANLREANLCEANLCEANLCKANLCQTNLHEANLRRANLCDAYFIAAILTGADLYEADLHGAKFTSANFRGTDLSEINLCRAELSGSDFRGADLRRAVLTRKQKAEFMKRFPKAFEEHQLFRGEDPNQR